MSILFSTASFSRGVPQLRYSRLRRKEKRFSQTTSVHDRIPLVREGVRVPRYFFHRSPTLLLRVFNVYVPKTLVSYAKALPCFPPLSADRILRREGGGAEQVHASGGRGNPEPGTAVCTAAVGRVVSTGEAQKVPMALIVRQACNPPIRTAGTTAAAFSAGGRHS